MFVIFRVILDFCFGHSILKNNILIINIYKYCYFDGQVYGLESSFDPLDLDLDSYKVNDSFKMIQICNDMNLNWFEKLIWNDLILNNLLKINWIWFKKSQLFKLQITQKFNNISVEFKMVWDKKSEFFFKLKLIKSKLGSILTMFIWTCSCGNKKKKLKALIFILKML